MFYEIVIAPSYSPAGLDRLKGKSKTLRILEAKARAPKGRQLRQVAGEMTPPPPLSPLPAPIRQLQTLTEACNALMIETGAAGTAGRCSRWRAMNGQDAPAPEPG